MAYILVIEDDPSILKLTTTALQSAGHDVVVASNGEEGLQRALHLAPDLVITDIMMPRVDGWELMRTLRTRKETALVPVILLSQLDGKEDRIRGFRLGADDYLPKPFHMEELVLRVERILARSAPVPVTSESDMSGRLDRIGLSSLMTLLDGDRATGTLTLTHLRETCEIDFDGGRITRVNLSSASGGDVVERIVRVLTWEGGAFRFTKGVVAGQGDPMTAAQLLLEAARRVDERAR